MIIYLHFCLPRCEKEGILKQECIVELVDFVFVSLSENIVRFARVASHRNRRIESLQSHVEFNDKSENDLQLFFHSCFSFLSINYKL